MTPVRASLAQRAPCRAIALAFTAALLQVAAAPPAAAGGVIKSATIERAFADARTDLQAAIVNQGLNIDFNGHLGDMLKRTAADVGATVEIYKNAEYFTFCSSRLSRAMMEADPLNAALCPYVMFVFEASDNPGKVTVGYRRMPVEGDDASKKALTDINALLDDILAEATE